MGLGVVEGTLVKLRGEEGRTMNERDQLKKKKKKKKREREVGE